MNLRAHHLLLIAFSFAFGCSNVSPPSTLGASQARADGGFAQRADQPTSGTAEASDAGAEQAAPMQNGATAGSAYDPRRYWVAGRELFVRANGTYFGAYIFQEHANLSESIGWVYNTYLNQGQSGKVMSWAKYYPTGNGGYCVPTYGILLLGDDQRVTETGDWFAPANDSCNPSVPFGYRVSGTPTGLFWAEPGGYVAQASPPTREMNVWRGETNSPFAQTNFDAFSRLVVVEHLDRFQPAYGRNNGSAWAKGNAAVYTDVIHLILYHGVRNNSAPTLKRCGQGGLPGVQSQHSSLYVSQPGYESYAMELYLAAGKGIVQESLLFNELDYWDSGTQDNTCHGSIMDGDASGWTWYRYEE